jgi:hypothetical protein
MHELKPTTFLWISLQLLQILPNTEDQHVQAAWEDIKQAICEAADNTLGQKPRMVRNGWYDEE